MKKFMNTADDFLKESLQGFGAAHQDIVSVYYDPNFITRSQPTKDGKVALISGGGSGHEPMHGGLVGHGMLDAACPGFVFSSPTPDQMLAAAEKVDSGAGVLFIVKNYSGDVMNFQMAAEMMQGPNESVLTNDDVAVEDSSFTTGRRGVAATVLVEKIVGSLAESGGSLQECKALGDKVNQNSGSMGVAFSSCTVPAAGKPTFELGVDEMEFGVGIHGEPGISREKLKSANDLTDDICNRIINDFNLSDQEIGLMINSLGATPLEELYIVSRRVVENFNKKNIKIFKNYVGRYATSMEMAGMSVTVLKLNNNIKENLLAPTNCPFWTN